MKTLTLMKQPSTHVKRNAMGNNILKLITCCMPLFCMLAPSAVESELTEKGFEVFNPYNLKEPPIGINQKYSRAASEHLAMCFDTGVFAEESGAAFTQEILSLFKSLQKYPHPQNIEELFETWADAMNLAFEKIDNFENKNKDPRFCHEHQRFSYRFGLNDRFDIKAYFSSYKS